MEDGPCVTPLMNMSNPRIKSHTALSFLMGVTATGPTVTISWCVDFLVLFSASTQLLLGNVRSGSDVKINRSRQNTRVKRGADSAYDLLHLQNCIF